MKLKKLTKRIIFYLNILVALCMLIAYLAPFINPAKLLFPAYFGLAYPYFLLLNLIFVVYWLIRMKKEVLISVFVILLGWGNLMNFIPIRFNFSSAANQELTENRIKVMSYNIRTFNLNTWTKTSNPRDGVYEIINKHKPSIVCLQEFSTETKRGSSEEDIRNKLGEYPHFSVHYSVKNVQQKGFGLCIFSKYPIVRTSRIPFNKTDNLAVYTDLEIGHDTIRLFNIHLQSIKLADDTYTMLDSLSLKTGNKHLREVREIGHRLRSAFEMRAEQAKIIHRYIKDSPYPVVVTGDFNDTPLSFAYRKIKSGLKDSFRKKGRGFGNTYAGELPSFRIDYILYSRSLKAIDYTRIKNRYSDHFPIMSTLELK